ncbi:MAG: ABC transporter permease [Candidatus Marinimicrobia bacterium]|nr:ABC transporter permease [Candidatus Neomarinimicrobiota bacterium]
MMFPLIGVVIGCILVTLTFAIMDGMEKKIFTTLREFSSPAKIIINKSNKNQLTNIEEFLEQNQIEYYKSIERNGILSNGQEYRFAKIRAVDKLEKYLKSINLKNDNTISEYKESYAILGNALAMRLNLEIYDEIKLISPLDINLITGIPPYKTVYLYDTFGLNILDYDINYAFVSYKTGTEMFKYSINETLLLNEEFEISVLNNFKREFPNIEYQTWKDKQQKLISAMKLEKLAYSTFGFLIVFIAGFNLLSMMSLSVMQKISQIGILKTIGYSNKRISKIFIIQSFVTGILGGLLGVGAGVVLIKLETKYRFLKVIFDTFPLKEFPLILSYEKIVMVFLVSVMLILISGIYPAYKSAKLNPIKSIDYIK